MTSGASGTTVEQFIEILRNRLRPRGTSSIVKLELGNLGYVDEKLVIEAIDELEKRMTMHEVYGPANPLEKLGILLLTETDV